MSTSDSRRLIFLFTDVEGSTPAWEADPVAMADAMRAHDEMVTRVLSDMGAIQSKHTGDGVMASFESAGSALDAAVVMQQALAPLPIKVRMGLHAGEAEARDGDFFGTDVNRAARVMAIAHGGQILVSALVAQLAQAAPTTVAQTELVDLGSHRLRGLFLPENVFQVCAPGLAAEFPPPNSLNGTIGNLSARPELIGRESELEDVATVLRSDRMIALIGPGGVGKTSLALAAAADAKGLAPDGSWFVDLTTVEPSGVAAAFANSFGLSEVPGGSEPALMDYLNERHMLIVVDNCEQVVDEVARLLEKIQQHAPSVTVLATSRIRIGVSGVRSISVRPLRTAADDSPAVELFVRRALQARAGIQLDQDRPTIREICAALDGLPLAIELAASRVAVLSPSDILKRLDQRFALLRSTESQSRTLLATLEWSFELLDHDSRLLFRNLGVFSAPFDLASAEAVAPDSFDDMDLLECLARLVDASLLVTEQVAGVTLYRCLESVREFAALKLADSEVAAEVADHHTEVMAGFAVAIGAEFFSDTCRDALELAGIRMRDSLAAIDRLIESDPERAASVMVSLRSALWLLLAPSVLLELNDKAIAAIGEPTTAEASAALVALLAQGSDVAWRDGDHNRSEALSSASLAMSEELGTTPDGIALLRRATILALNGERAEAIEYCEQVVAQSDADPSQEAYTLGAAGALLAVSGQSERGVALAQRALDASRRAGPYRMLTALLNLAMAEPRASPAVKVARAEEGLAGAHLLGSRFHEALATRALALAKLESNAPDALEALWRAIVLARDTGQRASVVMLVETFAAAVRGDHPPEAAALFAGAGVYRDELSVPSTPRETARRGRHEDELRATLGSEYRTAVRRGQGRSFEELLGMCGDVLDKVTADR